MSYGNQKIIKIFLNSMNTWFSNFIIEEFRTDHTPNAKLQYSFSTTKESSEPLPYLFQPKFIKIKPGYDYNQEIFDNDIIIFNLNDANLDEVEYVIRGLDNIKNESPKIFILISNIMTWANTPLKEYTNEEISKIGLNENEEEIPEYLYKKISSNDSDKNINIKKLNINLNEEIAEDKEFNSRDGDDKNKDEEDESIHEESDHNINENEKNNKDTKKNLKKIYYFNEEDIPKRIPYAHYSNFKMLETSTLQIQNPYIKKYIICPGFIYGYGEDLFFDYFKKAWLGGVEYFPIRGNGYNFIPTIHIKDLIELIKKIINIKPDINYILACDKTKEPFMKDILESITYNVGGIKLESVEEYNIDDFEITNYAELKINIPIKPSPFLTDSNLNDSFKWHCEFGIKENISKIISEFKLYRQINSLKIIISGPPSAGKSSLAEILSQKYKISKFNIKDICDWGEKNGDIGLIQEIKQKKEEIEEIIKKTLEEHEHKKVRKKTDPPLDISSLRKFPNDFVAKIIRERIKSDECLMKGYILDNFPKSYVDCQNLFCVELPPKKKEEEIKDIKESSKLNKDKKDKDKEKIEEIDYNREVIKDSLPDVVIMINNYNEESLKNKMQKNPEYSEKQQELDMRFNRRLETFKKYNESQDHNYRNLEDFFKENNVKIIYINETEYMENKTLIEENLIKDLENSGFVNNYSKLFDEEDEVEFIKPIVQKNEENESILNINDDEMKEENKFNENKIEDEKTRKKTGGIDIIKEDESEESMVRIRNFSKKKSGKIGIEKEKENEKHENLNHHKNKLKRKHSKDKTKENNENIEHHKKRSSNKAETTNVFKPKRIKTVEEQENELKEREQNLLEKKSEVIRRYLSDKIMPILAKGVLYVSRNLPDDPVEGLADFLLNSSFNLGKDMDKPIEELEKIIQETEH